LAEARAKATTLPRRAAVDPTAGAAERESATFIVSERVDRGRKRENGRTNREKEKESEFSTLLLFFLKRTKKTSLEDLSAPLSLFSSVSSSFTRRGAAASLGLVGLALLPVALFLSQSAFVSSHLSNRGSNGTNARVNWKGKASGFHCSTRRGRKKLA